VKAQEAVDGLERERDRVLRAFDALGESAGTVAVTEPGGWTAKDVLAHLIHLCGQIAFGLGAQLQPPAYVLEEKRQLTGQEWNDRAVAFWKDVPVDEVRSEFTRNADLLIERVRLRTDEEMASDAKSIVPWAYDAPLWQFVGHDTFLHEWPAHARQMEAAR
jgi:hypothetical protein